MIDPKDFQEMFNEAVDCMTRYMRKKKVYTYIYHSNYGDERDFLMLEKIIFTIEINSCPRKNIYYDICNTFSLIPIKYIDFRLHTYRATLNYKDFDKLYALCKLIGDN